MQRKRFIRRILKLGAALGVNDIAPFVIFGTRDDGIRYLARVMGMPHARLNIWEHGRGIDPPPLLLGIVQERGYEIERQLIDGQNFWIVLESARRHYEKCEQQAAPHESST